MAIVIGRLKFEIDELVAEMLDQIPQDRLIHGIVLDPAMGGGQFLKEVERRKRAAGKTDKEIKESVFGIEGDILSLSYAVNKNTLVGTYSKGNFLEKEIDMKFDVIVGNPPFQSTEDGSKRKKMWVQFAEMAMKKAEYVAFVTPNAWQKENSKYFKAVATKIKSKLVAYGDANEHFSIGEDVGFWIIHNSNKNPVTVANNNECSSIYEKMKRKGDKWHYRDFQQPEIIVTTTRNGKNVKSKVKFPATPTKEFCVPLFWTAKQIRYCRPADVTYSGWKVIVNNSGHYYSETEPSKYSRIDNEMAVGLGAWGIKANSKSAALRILSWVQSKLYRVVVAKMKTGGFNNPFIELESLGCDQTWTDEAIYRHFGLTQEEIDYVEANVK